MSKYLLCNNRIEATKKLVTKLERIGRHFMKHGCVPCGVVHVSFLDPVKHFACTVLCMPNFQECFWCHCLLDYSKVQFQRFLISAVGIHRVGGAKTMAVRA
ncbi:hypothetical protein OUZ56_030909 [Daphnia magna]|uniref:Uncharacterized protein n=1 Tax=Daphnia magna TaxID=35525 RepID=A0ABQ9ZSP3_9CRUS|nr:hypothetical protein OUZ56_030909 [Daphnia magna]